MSGQRSLNLEWDLRKTVRAQRKYAHKAYIPPGSRLEVSTEPAEADPAPAPILLKTQRTINDVLDVVSFQNGIHNHQDDKSRMVPRVVLERWSPVELMVARRTPTPPPERRSQGEAIVRLSREDVPASTSRKTCIAHCSHEDAPACATRGESPKKSPTRFSRRKSLARRPQRKSPTRLSRGGSPSRAPLRKSPARLSRSESPPRSPQRRSPARVTRGESPGRRPLRKSSASFTRSVSPGRRPQRKPPARLPQGEARARRLTKKSPANSSRGESTVRRPIRKSRARLRRAKSSVRRPQVKTPAHNSRDESLAQRSQLKSLAHNLKEISVSLSRESQASLSQRKSPRMVRHSLNALQLRNRKIKRSYPETPQTSMETKTNDSDVEDNRPLTYFSKLAKKDNPVASKSNLAHAAEVTDPQTESTGALGGVCSVRFQFTDSSVADRFGNAIDEGFIQIYENSGGDGLSIAADEQTKPGNPAYDASVDGFSSSTDEQADSLRNAVYNIAVGEAFSLATDQAEPESPNPVYNIAVGEAFSLAPYQPAQPQAPNPLYEFFVNIFDRAYTVERIDLTAVRDEESPRSTTPADSIERVNEWLSNNQRKNQIENDVFKRPSLPARRISSPTRSIISSALSRRVQYISPRETMLRAKCITWNHKQLSALLLDRNVVMKFCGQCSRCKIMFKILGEQTETSIDVYDFIVGKNEDEIPVIHNFKTILNNVCKENNYLDAIQLHMTESGKKILKVAILLKDKSETAKFTVKEQQLLAGVIGILNASNTSSVYSPSDARLKRNNSCANAMPTSSKNSVISVDNMSGNEAPSRDPKPLPKSPCLRISEDEFSKGLIKFSSEVQVRYPMISLCGIAPPKEFKPQCTFEETTLSFKMTNIYIHRMFTRWGVATQELTAIRSIQGSNIQRSPLFEGLEVDLVKLFHAVQTEGGIECCQNNIEKWKSVADTMKLVCRSKIYSKLENIYLKYLLDYNTLTSEEREKAKTDVAQCWAEREVKAVARAQQPLWRQERMETGRPEDELEPDSHIAAVCAEAEECVIPGRNINLAGFKKLALQVRQNHFPGDADPTPEQVEKEYWSIVMLANSHVCVHAASVDSSEHAVGFPTERNHPYTTHPWNLKRLRCSSENILSYLGPCVGVSSPVMQYGMVYSTSCWHMDPTAVPWVEYLHEGRPKIWYTISADQQNKFRAAAEALCPCAVQNKDIWLPSDMVMIPPNVLRSYGITVERHVQYAGEYVIVYPNTYCASINTGFAISEGVYFAPLIWIERIDKIFTNLRDCCEPSLFSMERLLMAMAKNERTPRTILQWVHTVLTTLLRVELFLRQRMANRGIELITPQVFLEQNPKAPKTSWQIQQSGECAYCRRHLFLSRVIGVVPNNSLCAIHGLNLFETASFRQEQFTNVFCIIMVSNAEIFAIINTLKNKMVGFTTSAV